MENKVSVTRVVSSLLDENTYLVYKNGRGFIIDPSGDGEVLDNTIKSLNFTPEALLLTHGHFDHCMLVKYYREKGLKAYIHGADADKLQTKKNLSLTCGISFPYTEADVLLQGGETLNIADIKINVIHTPGHSKGSVCYVIDEANALFSGDLLFKLSFGRTDFFDGDKNELKASFEKIFALKKNYTVYTGHGDTTSLDYERRNNVINLDSEDLY